MVPGAAAASASSGRTNAATSLRPEDATEQSHSSHCSHDGGAALCRKAGVLGGTIALADGLVVVRAGSAMVLFSPRSGFTKSAPAPSAYRHTKMTGSLSADAGDLHR